MEYSPSAKYRSRHDSRRRARPFPCRRQRRRRGQGCRRGATMPRLDRAVRTGFGFAYRHSHQPCSSFRDAPLGAGPESITPIRGYGFRTRSLRSRSGTTEKKCVRLRLLVPEQPQPLPFVPSLLAVADAVDRAGPVVGDEHRAVLGEHDVGRTAEIALIAFEPAGGKDLLLGVLAVGTDDHALDACALVLVPVPGAMLGDEDVVLVLGGELVAGIELHAERRHMGAELGDRWRELRALVTHRKLRIRHIALVAIGITEVLAELRDHVELVARGVVAHP